jgi:AcrR family transcriptional regulator
VTFYAHYPDKQALLQETCRELIQARLRQQVPEGTPFSTDNLAKLIQTVCDFIAEMNSSCSPPLGQMGQLMEQQCKAAIYNVLQDWVVEAGTKSKRKQRPADQAAIAASWAIYGAATHWSEATPREPAEELVEQVLPMILTGLRPKK